MCKLINSNNVINNLNLIKNGFRKEFPYQGKINWFPGHMIKNRKLISETMKFIDVVLEVRDSRAPISTENPILSEILKGSPKKTKVIIFNKSDLSNPQLDKSIKDHFNKQDQIVHFSQSSQSKHSGSNTGNGGSNIINKTNPKHPWQLIMKAVELHYKRFPPINNMTSKPIKKCVNMLICGLPNVGKSSFINSVRKASKVTSNSKSAKTGALPGVTRHISGFIASDDPPIFIVDTPGIMIPGNLDSTETTLTLALLGCISEKIVDQISLADFLLFKLNSINNFNYLKLLQDNNNNIKEVVDPTDDIYKFLTLVSSRHKMVLQNNKPDFEQASKYFISQYRDGKFGHFTLDSIPPLPLPTTPTTPIPTVNNK